MRISTGSVIVGLVALGCSTPQPTSESALGPCTQLSTLCDSCTQAGPKEECNQAVAGADDTRCEAVLDDPNVRAVCVPPDASTDVAADAPRTPACGDAGVADAVCACEADAGSSCAPSCPQGGCRFVCEPGATCAASCAGGKCVFDCKPGSQCMNSCAGGHCSFECEDGAICADTCSTPSTCVGP